MRRIVSCIIIIFSILVALFIVLFVSPQPVQKIPSLATNTPVVSESPKVPTPQDWLDAVNAERLKVGVPPLVLDQRLNQSAQRKANEMNLEGLDDTPHVNNQGVHGYAYAHESIPSCIVVSENLLWEYYTTIGGVNAWLKSPEHKKAMLDPKYTLTGFGIKGEFVVEHFCQI